MYKIVLNSVTDGESTQIITDGDVINENGTTSVSFVDSQTGDSTKIVINDEVVSIIKFGTISSILEFSIGEETNTFLTTPYGVLPIKLKTSSVKCERDNDSVRVSLDYNTYFESEVSRFEISLTATRRE